MPLPKLRFSWRPVAIDGEKWRLGLFCFYDAKAKSGTRLRAWRLALSLRGLLAWAITLGLAGWFLAAGALTLWFRQQPYNRIVFTDVAWPPHWREMFRKRGEMQIAQGIDFFKNHRWGEGQMALSSGLRHAPKNPGAWLTLAQFYAMANARALAKSTLAHGMDFGFPGREYFDAACLFAAQGGDTDGWMSLCDVALKELAARPAGDPDRQDALRQKMSALLAAGRPDDAIRLADAQGDAAIPAFGEVKATALLQAGRAADAVAFLDSWSRRFGASEQILRLRVRALREAGRLDEMEQAINRLCDANPYSPEYFAYGIIQRLLAGRRAEADRNIEIFLLQFGNSPKILFQLAEPLQEIDARPQVERVVKYVRDSGYDPASFDIVLLRVLVDKGDWPGAGALLATVRAEQKEASPSVKLWEDMVGLLCAAATDPSAGAQGALTDFARTRPLSLQTSLQLVHLLRGAGRPETARTLVAFAQSVYPENAALRAQGTELDAELAARAKAAPQPVIAPIVVSEKAVDAVMARAAKGSDFKQDEFFEQVAALEKTGDFAGALQKVRDMRRASPDWLSSREGDVERTEMWLNGRLGDLAALQLAADLYLNGDTARAVKATDLAKRLRASGSGDAALFLLRRIVKSMPSFEPAQRLLAEWTRTEASPAKP